MELLIQIRTKIQQKNQIELFRTIKTRMAMVKKTKSMKMDKYNLMTKMKMTMMIRRSASTMRDIRSLLLLELVE